jgi:hypothetical protein
LKFCTDARGADDTTPLVLPPIDLQQLAAQQQFQLRHFTITLNLKCLQ